MDVRPTVDAIARAADVLEDAAKKLRIAAARMEETNDLTYVSEAMSAVINAWPNMRLDLFVTRPLRAAMNPSK